MSQQQQKRSKRNQYPRNGKHSPSLSKIPRLPRIKRMSLEDEIELASRTGMNGMTSHNIASIVNFQNENSSNFLSEFIWEDDAIVSIDTSPPFQLQTAAKRKISPNKRKIVSKTKTKFKTMKQLKSHRFHLAELFQNDGIVNVRFCELAKTNN